MNNINKENTKSNNDLLESTTGEIKTTKEWQEEAVIFYKTLGIALPSRHWERFKKILMLQPIGDFRARKGKNYHNYEGKTPRWNVEDK